MTSPVTWHCPPKHPCGPVPPLPWHFMHTLPLLYTWFGWSLMKALPCGSSTPWQFTQNEVLWH